MKGWVKIKDMLINLDQVSAVQLTEDDIKLFAHGRPLAVFRKGLGPNPETITTAEFDRATKELSEKLGG